MRNISLIGRTNWQNQNILFGIKDVDRLQHVYCIGKTGAGKSTLLLNMAISDIGRGKGICVIDPHGDLSEKLLEYVPKHRLDAVIYFNASDLEYPIAFNPIQSIHPNYYPVVTSFIVGAFKKLWLDSWGPRLEHILRFSILSLLHYPSATLLDIQRILTEPAFRKEILKHVSHPAILSFWNNEFEKYMPSFKTEAIAPILNKLGLLNASTIVRNILGQRNKSFKMGQIMNGEKILICNLSKGLIGEDACSFIGSMILTSIQVAALHRATSTEDKRVPFYVYVDEMYSFITMSFVDILSESRKYGISLFLTHQYINQLDERIRAAIFGNVGTIISFRVGAEDARVLAKEFYPVFKEIDFIDLPQYSIYLRLMIDGTSSKPFSAITLPLNPIEHSYKNEIIKNTRGLYCNHRNRIEKELYTTENIKKESQNTLFS